MSEQARSGLRLWLSGLLIGIGLMVVDELLTLAQYCRFECQYPIPLLGTFNLYQAEGFAWLLILSGFALLVKRVSSKG